MSRSLHVPLPQYAKPLTSFADVEASVERSSGHTTKIVAKKRKEDNAKNGWLWVFKEFKKNPESLSQIEAAMAAFHRALSGSAFTPKVRPVYKRETENSAPIFFATVSKVFSHFMDLQTYLGDDFGAPGKEKETDKKLKALIKGGIGRLLKFAILLGEGDLHKGNIGVIYKIINGEKIVENVVRIDFDDMPEPMLSQSHLRGTQRNAHTPKFIITAHDKNTFPVLNDADPYYWPTIFRLPPDVAGKLSLIPAHGYSSAEVNVFSTLKDDDDCVKDSHFADLIFELFPDETRNNIFTAFVTDVVLRETFSQYFSAKKEESRNASQKSVKFKEFWESLSSDSIDLIRKEFLAYNAGLKEKHQNFY